MKEPKTVLVTGGSGYIGSVLCPLLVDAGYNVINVDHAKKEMDGVTQYPFDIGSNQLRGVFEVVKPDSVIHLAGSTPESIASDRTDVADYYINNVSKTIALLETSLVTGVSNFIYASSTDVYGHNGSGMTMAEGGSTSPKTAFARSKLMIEQIATDFGITYDMNVLGIRLSDVGGNIEDRDVTITSNLVETLIAEAATGEINVDNRLDCEFDVIHVFDAARAFEDSIDYLDHNVSHDSIFNATAGDAGTFSMEEIALEVARQIEPHPMVNAINTGRTGPHTHITYANNRIKDEMGWIPNCEIIYIVETALKFK